MANDNITVEAIISLPQGIFNPYTDVKTSILLLTKKNPRPDHKTWLVNMSNDGFDLNLKRFPIEKNDIPKIKNLWERWGGYDIETANGDIVTKSFHKEEKGFAEFHKLNAKNWCVKRYNTPLDSLGSKYELVSIGSLLSRVKETVYVDPNVLYKSVTIQMHNRGLVLRDEKYGLDIGTKKQFYIREGQFVISKIDARNGAYGIVPKELHESIITGNFWAYRINSEKVLPEYLTYLMRHRFFIDMCKTCSYGVTNRWYLDEETFINFKIPLPKIKQQKEIIKQIKIHTEIIDKANKEINHQNDEIMTIIDSIVN